METCTSDAVIKVLLADDHAIFREGVRSALLPYDFVSVVGEAADGAETVRKAKELAPDMVLMDISMPIMNGVEATRILRREMPEIKVLILTVHKNNEYVIEIIESGANGYLLKETSGQELARAIKTVFSGKSFFSAEISSSALDYVLHKGAGSDTAHLVRLSTREREVLGLIAKGSSSKDIANNMGVTVRTVETHRERLMRKLHIHNVAGLTRFAIGSGLIDC
jgi:two-component system nitrate/nitrite response regulator NarL